MATTDTEPSAAATPAAKPPTRTRRRFSLPAPPLWLIGLVEAAQILLITILLVGLPVLVMSLAGGFSAFNPNFVVSLAAQVWLVLHGTPVELVITLDPGALGGALEVPGGGWFHLVPLGLTLIPLWLGWRAGGRIARGSYSDQLWQGLLPLILGYAAGAAGIAWVAQAATFQVMPWLAALCAAVLMSLAALAGCYAEARSAARMIGTDLEARIDELSQRLRWAGSYAWAVGRAGLVGFVAACGLAALLLAGQLGVQWMQIANVYEQLNPGIAGVLGLTILHLGLAPNLILWALAYSTGSGFALGSGSLVSPLGTELGAVPAVPVLAALPVEAHPYGLFVLGLPVLAGVLAGWWLMREGENHLDDWFTLRISWRPLAAVLSTLSLGVLTGLVTALLAVGPLWLSHISLGVGRMTDIGPHALLSAGMLGVWVALGAILGYSVSVAGQRLRRRTTG
ncbi:MULTISPECIES: cell division protein PerM [unclassified Nesterenkonia]|uniref:cell division protein PerM n=1 Tax=unclassified Nesterenkonia TaxID=2629769 RepID=UPI001F4C8B4D|nr:MULTISPECIES: DUF6350 family protein [unclassified Nesterenkonia]MCH8560646.1 DUF6350 family protein [Nesterenkonia sp. DZ6]MCH8562924.1 DUF6350 family protein [Nesterenkonia sp. YGD6]MCH8570754.1 DUF6350 family protein [Nesterenkonia sp. AY15]